MSDSQIVHVIDDDDAARDSLRFLLESARLMVRTYDSAVKFLSDLPRREAGCVVTDVRMPEMTGIDFLRRLKQEQTAFPVIVITGHGDIALAVEAMKLGAIDFFEKPFDDDALLSSVSRALSRQEDDAKRTAAKAEIISRLATLSPREREVLEGLVAGQPNKNIAMDLAISPRTVEIYRANVMTKMNASSLSELVRMALIANVAGDPR
jgi:two-component system response regulator FixJ